MEKSQTDFVQECLAEIAALKERITALERKLEDFPVDEPQEATPVMEEEPEANKDLIDFLHKYETLPLKYNRMQDC